MDLHFDGLGEARCRVDVTAGSITEVKVALSGIRRSLHLGDHVGCELHWACLDDEGGWYAPEVQPSGSRSVDPVASRIECKFSCSLVFPTDKAPKQIVFVAIVHANDHQHWLKAPGGKDLVIPVQELAETAAKFAPPSRMRAASGQDGGGGAPWRVADRPKEWKALGDALAAAAEKKKAGKKKQQQKTIERRASTTVEGELGKIDSVVVQGPGGGVSVFVEANVMMPEDAMLYLHFGCVACPGAEWSSPAEPVEGTEAFGDGKATRALLNSQSRTVLQFSEKSAPGAISFVLYAVSLGAEHWLKTSDGGDFSIAINEEAAVATPDAGQEFCDAETKYTHWTHFQRLCMFHGIFARETPVTEVEAAWTACILRLASNKELDWYRKRGYQPKDMAGCSESVGWALASAVKKSASPTIRAMLRLAARCIPRGDARCGDDVRHGILNIMRTHGIKEGHRPGIECHFIEQWHQKLHTNSAPDDIVICEGYLAFLRSGNPDDLFRTVYERGGITREDLGKMCNAGWRTGDCGLNVTPKHLPQLYDSMNGYLHLLKRVHGGTDLFALCEACKGQYPDHGSECLAFEIFNERDNPWTMGKIVDLRNRLQGVLDKRDVLMLDAALEDQFRNLAERQDYGNMARDDMVGVLVALLRDLKLSRQDTSLEQGMDLLLRLHEGDHGGVERWGKDWCKYMMAACDRISLVCAGVADRVGEMLQSCADKLQAAGNRPGAVFTPNQKVTATFGEETARCLSERVIAQCLKCLQPQLRRGAGLGPWEVVSSGAARVVGTVDVMKALPGELPAGKAPCIAVTETLTGWEDIPAGIVALLLPAAHAVDVLSHVAIRARNQKVLLASCDDDNILKTLQAASGQMLKLAVDPSGEVTWSTAAASDASHIESTPTTKKLTVVKPPAPPCDVLPITQFVKNRKSLGGKSFHLAELKPKNCEYKVPPSATIPFGMFETVLASSLNDDFREQLEDLIEEERWADVRRYIVDEMQIPDKLEAAVLKEMATQGAPIPEGEPWQRAMKGVWASKWTDRAISSRRQMGVPEDALVLAVLAQPLAFAAYAFVIHTRSPLTNAHKEDALVEVVVGLGESLVSNSPGRALSATVGPKERPIEVHTFPSKFEAVFTPAEGTHIFRSDSNGEDLEGFAGAGLYDSITVAECPKRSISYADEALLFNKAFRDNLLRKLFDLGRLVEANFNGQPQDIEGAMDKDGGLIVLQSRPQV
eukprot:TRINITY_DN28998_c0_g1_i1.p1 TRINITY_DN28998_c0_g1~~TRINITY_DN28998_c0_g1_i1.p1  ORF type:complete len:1220 (-),score=235.15 TRINITY_DN28998_c0_g1_i1:257-3916(-)